jgi:uncharacterized protein DUF4118
MRAYVPLPMVPPKPLGTNDAFAEKSHGCLTARPAGAVHGLVTAPERESLVVAAALIVPFAVCGIAASFRDDVANTTIALGLVLIVVAVAATGHRIAGVVAALSSAIWFDFFLTEPHYRFAITHRDDIETTVLLTAVSLAVTEIAVWGRRQQAQSSRREGYLAGVVSAAGVVASGSSTSSTLIELVETQIKSILDIDECRFDAGAGAAHPRLNRDGSVTQRGHEVQVERDGLPTDDLIELRVEYDGTVRGRFLLTAATQVSRPSLEQRLVSVALADQVGAALASPKTDA